MSEINTTPLVDVMMVLLIIFLITIPVITKTIPVKLPKANNSPMKMKPKDVTISVDKAGDVFWNGQYVKTMQRLVQYVSVAARENPQPEIHIRGDGRTDYENVGKVIAAINRGGVVGVSFVIQPSAQAVAAGAAAEAYGPQ